jgi:hypothetical protein
MKEKQNLFVHRGLALSRKVLRRLNEVGIFAQPHVSLEHQHLARRYVVRGIESGGAVSGVGRYVTFCGADGGPLECLHPIDSIGVNGLHAVVVAPVLVRIELFRCGRTCQLLITRHEPGKSESGKRPPLENSVQFHGVNGYINASALRKDDHVLGTPLPQFWTRGGEGREISSTFAAAVHAAMVGAGCVGCSHNHFLVAPRAVAACVGTLG